MHMLLVFILALATSAFAQTTTASLSGTVSDSSGGVVPGAKITATNLDTQGSVNLQIAGSEGGVVTSSGTSTATVRFNCCH